MWYKNNNFYRPGSTSRYLGTYVGRANKSDRHQYQWGYEYNQTSPIQFAKQRTTVSFCYND